MNAVLADDNKRVVAHTLRKQAPALTAVPVTQLNSQAQLLERMWLKEFAIPNLGGPG